MEILKSKAVVRELITDTKIDGVDFVTYYMTKNQASLKGNIYAAFGTTPKAVNDLLFGWMPKGDQKPRAVLTKEERKEVLTMQVISKIQSMISLDVEKESSVVRIFVTSVGNPKEASLIANLLPIAYDAFKSKEKTNGINKGLNVIREQLAEKAEKIKTLRSELSAIRVKYHITMSQEEPIKMLDPETVSRTKAALMDAKIDMLLEKKTWVKIQNMEDSELSEAFGVLMDDSTGYMELKNDLNNATLQFKLLKIDFGQSHPKVKRAKVELEELTKQMRVRLQGIKGAMKLRYEKSVTKYEGIKTEFDELNSELSGERSRDIQKFNIVASNLIFAKDQLDSVRKILAQKEVNQRLPRSVIEVISPATTPFHRSSPNHMKNIAISIFLGLALSIGLVFFLDYLDNTIKTIPQIEQLTGMNVIATIPVLDSKSLEKGHSFAEILNAPSGFLDAKCKVWSIHSSMPGEGKSTVCVRTAIESARTGNRVLVIDMDVRRPTAHRGLNVELEGGIADVLRSRTVDGLASIVKETSHEGVSVVTAGLYKDAAPLTPKLMVEILEALKEDYELIILDCPPVAVVSESLIMANASDEMILVVRPGHTKVKLVTRAISMFEGMKCGALGVVANQVERKSVMYYSNQLYNKYYS